MPQVEMGNKSRKWCKGTENNENFRKSTDGPFLLRCFSLRFLPVRWEGVPNFLNFVKKNRPNLTKIRYLNPKATLKYAFSQRQEIPLTVFYMFFVLKPTSLNKGSITLTTLNIDKALNSLNYIFWGVPVGRFFLQ